jgi:hypothetical protein
MGGRAGELKCLGDLPKRQATPEMSDHDFACRLFELLKRRLNLSRRAERIIASQPRLEEPTRACGRSQLFALATSLFGPPAAERFVPGNPGQPGDRVIGHRHFPRQANESFLHAILGAGAAQAAEQRE